MQGVWENYVAAAARQHCECGVIAGLAAVADRSAYNASKHGLIGLTRTLGAKGGGHGVRVNAVCPGWVRTEMDIADKAGGNYTDQDIIERVPMARFARPEDIAKRLRFGG